MIQRTHQASAETLLATPYLADQDIEYQNLVFQEAQVEATLALAEAIQKLVERRES